MMKRISILIIAILLAPLALLPPVISDHLSHQDSSPKVVELTASQFAFKPEVIKLNVGEKVIFRVNSSDVTHGVYIDGQKLHVDVTPDKTVDIGPVTFDKPGKFKIRCSTICGPLHPFMIADVVVEPNTPLYAFFSIAAVTAGGVLFYRQRAKDDGRLLGVPLKSEVDLLRLRLIGPILKKLVQWRGYHYFIILPNALIFMFVLTSGFFGNPTGALNFSIAVVWILWFAAVEFMIFFGSRFWCSICPLYAFGEWLVRRRIYSVHEPRKWFSLKRVFPKSLSNMWIVAFGFLGISLIVPWLVTRPVVTAFLFLILIAGGLIMHLIYTHRYFCRYVCPASGYIGYHSSASIFAVRSRDKSVCDKCVVKGCTRGTPGGYGCPWKLYPGGNESNINCGVEFECVRSCPVDNMTLKLQMFAKDVVTKVRTKADEAWMGFIRFTLAIFYELVFFGPYFWIKDWGNMGVAFGANIFTINVLTPTLFGFRNWLGWAVMVSAASLIIFPAIFYAFSWLAKKTAGDRENSTKNVFLALSNVIAPYGLLLWMAFGVGLVGVNWAYPIRAFSDPLGWGWNLLGTGDFKWEPFMPNWLPYIQSVFVFLGLALAVESTYKISLNLFKDHRRAIRSSAVMAPLHVAAASVFLYLLMG